MIWGKGPNDKNLALSLLSASSETLVFSNSSITEIFLLSPFTPPSLSTYINSTAIYNQNVSILNNTVINSGGAVVTYTQAQHFRQGWHLIQQMVKLQELLLQLQLR